MGDFGMREGLAPFAEIPALPSESLSQFWEEYVIISTPIS
jgi:hypothetical protein